MNTKTTILLGGAAICLVVSPAHADGFNVADRASRDRDEAAAVQSPIPSQSLGDLRRANDIIGREIVDDHNQKLGKVKDLALDLNNGRVAEVIVATSGALGMDQKLVAVPPSSFICDRTQQALRFNADENVFRNSPEFNLSQWISSTQYVEVHETYQRFNVPPYFLHDEQPATPSTHAVENYYSSDRRAPLPKLGFVARATRLTGTTAMNSLDERLGKVNDYVIDLPTGRLVEVILSSGGRFLGVGSTFRAVPPEAFHWNAEHNSLTLETTSEAFRVAPHFKSGEWGYAMEPSTIGDVYESYHVRPYFISKNVDLNAQNVRTPAEAPSPLQSSNELQTNRLYSTPSDAPEK